jgi:hypothetical protein
LVGLTAVKLVGCSVVQTVEKMENLMVVLTEKKKAEMLVASTAAMLAVQKEWH